MTSVSRHLDQFFLFFTYVSLFIDGAYFRVIFPMGFTGETALIMCRGRFLRYYDIIRHRLKPLGPTKCYKLKFLGAEGRCT